jgi:putative membrane-bound dehydrogenase-like protein
VSGQGWLKLGLCAATAAGIWIWGVAGVADEAGGTGIRVPDGFRVQLYAGDDLAHDIHSLTIDSQGRVAVSGPGYIRILEDRDGNGTADSAITFSDRPSTGSQGMYFHGSSLLCSGDEGLLIFRDDNNDGRADGPPQTFLKIAAGGEHHVHSIQRGPDGWWYVIAGNFSGVTGSYATAASTPVRSPVSGTILRLSPDLRSGEIVADGFRNAYDFAFGEAGDLFTWDSDDERDISLPWYLPTQVYHVIPGSNAGYVTAGLKRPGTYADTPPVVAQFGRGSPTGVLCYRHDQFPAEYRGALFVQDWTFGRILLVRLQRSGSGWSGEPAEFALGENQFGFAPTDMEVGPDGSLYASVGGRGTRGGVYRIWWAGPDSGEGVEGAAESGAGAIGRVLRARQPNAAWSRSQWVPLARALPRESLEQAALDGSLPESERVRAIETAVELHGGLGRAALEELSGAAGASVRARAAWAIGRQNAAAPDVDLLRPYLRDADPLVQRLALEALSGVVEDSVWESLMAELATALAAEDRGVRFGAALLIGRMSAEHQATLESAVSGDLRARLWFYLGQQQRRPELNSRALRAAVEVLEWPESDVEFRREAVRVLQLGLSDMGPTKGRPVMFDGYAPRVSAEPIERDLNPLLGRLFRVLPAGDVELDRELIRFFAMTAPLNRELLTQLLAQLTAESSPQEDIHRLAAISRFELERSYAETETTARALLLIDHKLRRLGMKQDTNWDDRMGELYAALCRVDPALPSLIPQQPEFGLSAHVLYLGQSPAAVMPQAIAGFLRHLQGDVDAEWTNDVVFAIGESGDPAHRELLRAQLDNQSVRDAVLIVLAEQPLKEDRQSFVQGLESPQLNAVEACLGALAKLPRTRDPGELYALLSAARRLMNDKREFSLRERAMRLMQNNTEQTLGFVFGEAGYEPQRESLQAWEGWLKQRYPEYRPANLSGDVQGLLASLESVSWGSGEAERGRRLFERLGCAKCHGGRRSLGPDLAGISKRFSRNDLFAAIADPNRDISARYQTTTVETRDGRVISGLIVYESVDGLLLRDADHRTWRIESTEIAGKHLQRNSLMPAGLLRGASAEDLADLYKYLQGL